MNINLLIKFVVESVQYLDKSFSKVKEELKHLKIIVMESWTHDWKITYLVTCLDINDTIQVNVNDWGIIPWSKEQKIYLFKNIVYHKFSVKFKFVQLLISKENKPCI